MVVDIDLLQQTFQTSMVIKPLKVVKYCVVIVQLAIERKSMTVSGNTIQAEGLDEFIKNLGQKGLILSKKIAKVVLEKPRRALEI